MNGTLWSEGARVSEQCDAVRRLLESERRKLADDPQPVVLGLPSDYSLARRKAVKRRAAA